MRTKSLTMMALRLVLSLVVLAQSGMLLFDAKSIDTFARHGLPDALRLILGWGEVVAGMLFLIPPTLTLGGFSLLAVFCAAAAIHIVHGEFGIGSLLVYSAAVMVVLTHRNHQQNRADEIGTENRSNVRE